MRAKKIAAAVLALCLLLGLSACGEKAKAKKGTVYWLNDDMARSTAAMALADRYERETGVTVNVVTPSAENYLAQLTTLLDRRDPPTLFVAKGEELPELEGYCLDLNSTALRDLIRSDAPVLNGTDGSLCGMGYEVDSFGLIVNARLLKRAGYAPEDIGCYEDLRRVAEDIQARADALGFVAFTSAGMARGSTERYTRQLFNLVVAAEYRDQPSRLGKSVYGIYMNKYRSYLELWLENSTRTSAELEEVNQDAARSEFAAGEAVFYQGGSWELTELTAAGLKAEDLTMIPLYLGLKGEEERGLCTNITGYLCVNRNAEEENVLATLEFLRWCAADAEAVEALGLERVFADPAASDDPFLRADWTYTAAGKTPEVWYMDMMPDDRWERDAGEALAQYTIERSDEAWNAVRKALVDGWTDRVERSKN